MLPVALAGQLAAACGGPAGAVLDVVSRERKEAERRELAEKIRLRWRQQDAARFQRIKVEVSFSNTWENLFATQYTIVLTGSVSDEWDRELAVLLAKEVLGVDSRRLFVTNLIRIEK